MKDIIKLKSRYNENNRLVKFTNPVYILKTDVPSVRVGYDSKNNQCQYIDPSGGPMIIVGEYLEEAEAVVDKIVPIPGYGYAVIFKE